MNTAKSTTKDKNFKPLIFIVALLAAVAAAVIIALVFGDSAKAPNNNDIATSTEWKPFKSSEHGFTVSFPGFPTTDRQDLDVYGVIVPYTTYTKETNDRSFVAAISNYPEQIDIMSNPRGVLDGSINGSAQNSGSTIEESSNDIEFLGNPAGSAVLKSTSGGKTMTMYALYFLKDNNLYMLMAAGVSQSDFDKFTSSFHFN